VDKQQKERQVEHLAERLRSAETLIVADYRGLTMPQIDALRTKLLEQGVRFTVVKNTLTRRAAEEAGADALLALLDGPTAIAFLESGGDPVAVAKALQDAARDTQVLAVRGGVLQGRTITSDDVAELAKLPPLDVLRGQVLGAVTAPLTAIVGLFTAPLQDLVGLIDARIEQLEAQGESAGEPEASAAPEAESPAPEAESTSEPEAPVSPAAEPEPEAADTAQAGEPAGQDEESTQADATASASEGTEEPTQETEEQAQEEESE
jgi:large subunit ribosomal protein L10